MADQTAITIGKEARLMFTSGLSRAVANLKATHCLMQYDFDERTLRLKLLRAPGNNPDVYKLTAARGRDSKHFSVSAKAALTQIGYDYSTRKTYEAHVDPKQSTVDVTLAPERLARSKSPSE
jgi:hypothetical protein